MNQRKFLIDEDAEVFDYQLVDNAEEMLGLIDNWYNEKTKNQRTKAYKEWVVELVKMNKHYNKIVGFKCLKEKI